MRLPRHVSGNDLIKALQTLGYEVSRHVGSHARLTTHVRGEHHVTIPLHDPLRLGTLNAVLRDVAAHHEMSRDALVDSLFGKKGH